MARTPDAVKGQDARRLIAEAACDLVAERGLDHVTLRRIAGQLGVTTGYITHYYVDKDDLLEAALLSALGELTTKEGGWSRNLDEWVDAAVEILPNAGGSQRFWRVLTVFQAASLTSARLADVLNTYARNSLTNLSAHLAAHLDVDHTQEIDELARSIFAFVSSLGTLTVTTPGVLSAAQARTLVRSGLSGLIKEFADRREPGATPDSVTGRSDGTGEPR
ncbi:TetR/AcrR family transcriptional regulator [Dietzia kunjamensis]|uniref:TetR/AcrR family transcriptional regulator n=1 Tax=Dietzia kunjamensis TaxID=322509 RepID=UPI002DB92524|nr:TetR/AcrR family transcriptional regulator [Dietzia kunjamensis]MEB8326083.1 TetR/AcrR family transcriptional regulator [Dietzia kunjamensis]